jgi:hypothetical protein
MNKTSRRVRPKTNLSANRFKSAMTTLGSGIYNPPIDGRLIDQDWAGIINSMQDVSAKTSCLKLLKDQEAHRTDTRRTRKSSDLSAQLEAA